MQLRIDFHHLMTNMCDGYISKMLYIIRSITHHMRILAQLVEHVHESKCGFV